MPEVIADAKSAPRMMLDALEKLFGEGWIVTAVVEQMFSGELQPPSMHEVGVNDPKNVTVAHFFLPHGDHYHEWILVLVKPEVDVTSKTLSTDFATVLKMMDMDETATVHAHGNA